MVFATTVKNMAHGLLRMLVAQLLVIVASAPRPRSGAGQLATAFPGAAAAVAASAAASALAATAAAGTTGGALGGTVSTAEWAPLLAGIAVVAAGAAGAVIASRGTKRTGAWKAAPKKKRTLSRNRNVPKILPNYVGEDGQSRTDSIVHRFIRVCGFFDPKADPHPGVQAAQEYHRKTGATEIKSIDQVIKRQDQFERFCMAKMPGHAYTTYLLLLRDAAPGAKIAFEVRY